jgi:hypothetical protein
VWPLDRGCYPSWLSRLLLLVVVVMVVVVVWGRLLRVVPCSHQHSWQPTPLQQQQSQQRLLHIWLARQPPVLLALLQPVLCRQLGA